MKYIPTALAATKYKLSARRLRDLAAQGRIACKRPDRRTLLLDVASVEAYLRERKGAGRPRRA